MAVTVGSTPGTVMQNTPFPERRTKGAPLDLLITGEPDELSTKPNARESPAAPGAPVAPVAPTAPGAPPGPRSLLRSFFLKSASSRSPFLMSELAIELFRMSPLEIVLFS